MSELENCESQILQLPPMELPSKDHLNLTPPYELCSRTIRLELHHIHACIDMKAPDAFNAHKRVEALVYEMNSRGVRGDGILLQTGDMH